MKYGKRQVKQALAALWACLTLCTMALAAGSSLIVRLESDEGARQSGIRVELRQVTKNGTLTEDFRGCGYTAAELRRDYGAKVAQELYAYAAAANIPAQSGTTDDQGEVHFGGLEAGLYLVSEPGGQKAEFLPYLVELTGSGETLSEPKVEIPGTKSLTVTKIWDDGKNADGVRPASIEVRLIKDGSAVRRVTLSAANGWKHTFTGLDETGTYSVEEAAVSGYTASYKAVDGGFVITNYHEPESTEEHMEITVRKVWADNENAAGRRPGSVTVQLVQNGTVAQTAVLSPDNDWTSTFTGLLPGKTYSVREITVASYSASYSGSAEVSFTITNTYVPDPGDPDDPDTPTPDNPDVPPDTPTPPAPDNPDPPAPSDPDEPTIPQTGAYTWPMYLLFAAGAVLIALGAADLYRGRRDV